MEKAENNKTLSYWNNRRKIILFTKKKSNFNILKINYNNLKISLKPVTTNIKNYLLLNKKSVKSFFIEFFTLSKQTSFKKNYKKKKKLYFFNFYKKKIK